MKGSRTTLVVLLVAAFSFAVATAVMAGAGGGYAAKAVPYEGQIKSIKIDKCGLQPGTCEGSVILAQAANKGEVTLAIRPGTWLKRGENLVTIDELGVGNHVKVEAVQIPGQQLQQITILSSEG
jgi:hypothetical protein